MAQNREGAHHRVQSSGKVTCLNHNLGSISSPSCVQLSGLQPCAEFRRHDARRKEKMGTFLPATFSLRLTVVMRQRLVGPLSGRMVQLQCWPIMCSIVGLRWELFLGAQHSGDQPVVIPMPSSQVLHGLQDLSQEQKEVTERRCTVSWPCYGLPLRRLKSSSTFSTFFRGKSCTPSSSELLSPTSFTGSGALCR